MNKPCMVVVALALAGPAAVLAQQHSGGTTPNQSAHNVEANQMRSAQQNARTTTRGEDDYYRASMGELTKLRAKLTQSWQGMGMSPQAAQQVANAYDPEQAANSHHTSLRGKSDQEVATLLQQALAAKQYLKADQLLIDYQREKLRLGAMTSADRTR